MKIAWISSLSGNFKQEKNNYVGGWIGALQKSITKAYPDLELAIIFPYKDKIDEEIEGNVTYIPVYRPRATTNFAKLKERYFGKNYDEEEDFALKILDKINKFKPDVVHIWGIEGEHANIIRFLESTPFIVHIQGLATPYVDSFFPPGYSVYDLKKADGWINWKVLKRGNLYQYHSYLHRKENEKKLAPLVQNWIGRTDWDKTISKIMSPNSKYFHCDEMLRSNFKGEEWKFHYTGDLFKIVSIARESWYKGIDIIIKTARVLREMGFYYEWEVYGMNPNGPIVTYILKKENGEGLNIKFKGMVDSTVLRKSLLNGDVYVHPAYIENSSNAIAEAMLLGIPVIAQNVGGNASMLKEDSGVLVASNEPFIMASKIMEITQEEIANNYSKKALNISKQRQSEDKILKDIMKIYNEIKRNN